MNMENRREKCETYLFRQRVIWSSDMEYIVPDATESLCSLLTKTYSPFEKTFFFKDFL